MRSFWIHHPVRDAASLYVTVGERHRRALVLDPVAGLTWVALDPGAEAPALLTVDAPTARAITEATSAAVTREDLAGPVELLVELLQERLR